MYVELVEKKITNRGKIVPYNQVNNQPASYERYMSLFPYDYNIQKHVELTGSVRGYKGKHYCPVVMIDIDSDDNLQAAMDSAIKLIEKLYKDHNLHPDDLSISFSGSKGFHVGIYSQSLGVCEPCINIPQKVKSFVSSICEGIDHVDLVIYEGARLFRIFNSLNAKSNRYKIPLHTDELKQTIEKIIKLAENPRPDFKRKKAVSTIKVNPALQGVWQETLRKPEITPPKNGTITNIFSIPVIGTRNNTLFKQACLLFNKSELNKIEIQNLLGVINAAGKDPLSSHELQGIINSAALKTNHKDSELELRSFGGWLPDWYDSLREDQNKLTLGLPAFDKEMRSKLRGKLCVVLGKGGTKKSLYAQNLAFRNLDSARTIYSTMEMGATGIVGRGIDMATDLQGIHANASYYLEEKDKQTPGYARKTIEEDIKLPYSDNLLITQNTSLTTPEYYKLINTAEGQYGPVDILIVDGLSMMGGKGTETELVNRHTKELKQLAIDKNVLVVLIVHVTKEGEKTTRDLSKLARGSEKIIDNCDFYISMSLIKRPTLDDEEIFEDRYGFIRLVTTSFIILVFIIIADCYKAI